MPGRSERESAISTPKPIQLILARQLASSLAMPIIIVDTLGTLIYYNEPAEKLLAQRFEETGERPAERWGAVFDVQDEERRPVPSHEWPLVVALTQEKPVSRVIWLLCPDGIWRNLNWTSVPLIAQSGKFLGVQSVFWEA
jgi:PAS domain-containing protein